MKSIHRLAKHYMSQISWARDNVHIQLQTTRQSKQPRQEAQTTLAGRWVGYAMDEHTAKMKIHIKCIAAPYEVYP